MKPWELIKAGMINPFFNALKHLDENERYYEVVEIQEDNKQDEKKAIHAVTSISVKWGLDDETTGSVKKDGNQSFEQR